MMNAIGHEMNDQDRFFFEVTRQQQEEADMEWSVATGNWDEIAEDPAWDVFINIRKTCMAMGEAEREYLAFLDSQVPMEVGCEFDE